MMRFRSALTAVATLVAACAAADVDPIIIKVGSRSQALFATIMALIRSLNRAPSSSTKPTAQNCG